MLVVNPQLVRTGEETFWDVAEGREIRLGRALTALVRQFAVPSTVDAAISSLGAGDAATTVSSAVEELLARRVLVRHEPRAAVAGRAGGLFRSPVLTMAEALGGDVADAVVLGMPYDVAVTYRPGTRFGPEYLRRVSGSLFQYRVVEGVPSGMHDPVRGRRVLSGVRLADIGDVTGTVFSRNGAGFDAVEQVMARLAAAGRFPVLLGGDHSITLPAVRGMLAAHPRLGVLHVDAHADYAVARTDDWREDCHHGNFMSWIVGDDRVERIAQFGIRQLTEQEPYTPDKVIRWPGTTASGAVSTVLDGLPDDLPYYLTVDVDGLDPTTMPATGTPLPGGFSGPQLISLLEAVCAERRVVGMDLVELLPDEADRSGLVAAEIILRVLDATLGRGRR
ncbi:arginase family protein [Thermoactinospora rubra]|uniref:arginase family protein n=1 Tax=Thermoactinospora rubra TaxID=1088767 RepID=UPI000A12015D|nr:arginase family protein [Thermoactinospora rubra]